MKDSIVLSVNFAALLVPLICTSRLAFFIVKKYHTNEWETSALFAAILWVVGRLSSGILFLVFMSEIEMRSEKETSTTYVLVAIFCFAVNFVCVFIKTPHSNLSALVLMAIFVCDTLIATLNVDFHTNDVYYLYCLTIPWTIWTFLFTISVTIEQNRTSLIFLIRKEIVVKHFKPNMYAFLL